MVPRRSHPTPTTPKRPSSSRPTSSCPPAPSILYGAPVKERYAIQIAPIPSEDPDARLLLPEANSLVYQDQDVRSCATVNNLLYIPIEFSAPPDVSG